MAYNQHQYRSPFGDTTLTKVFVGGLAWETPTEKMRDYFQQFGHILEAVVITDKYTGHSKGYGFVTFRDPDSATRACANPNPMIDGRRTNCNIASQGRPRPRGRGEGTAPLLSPASSQFGEMQNPVQTMPPHNPFVYPSYGYTPGYGYHHAIYHPQQQQYYAQVYGYSLPAASRGTAFSPSPQRMPYYLYYSPAQVEQPSTSPYTNSVQNPPLLSTPPTRQQTPSTSADSHVQLRRTTTETEVVVETSRGSSST